MATQNSSSESVRCILAVKLQQLEALLEGIAGLGHYNRGNEDPEWVIESNLLQLAGDLTREAAAHNRREQLTEACHG